MISDLDFLTEQVYGGNLQSFFRGSQPSMPSLLPDSVTVAEVHQD